MEPVSEMPQANADAVTALSGHPDWNLIKREIACPLCEYNLRGLTQPRCPECGYTFDWTELLSADTREHPYLFEHHPKRNVWSFWKTAVGGLRPWKFWSSLRPDQTSRPRRLMAYWATGMVLAFMLLFWACIGVWVQRTASYNSNSASYRFKWSLEPRSYFDWTAFWDETVAFRYFYPRLWVIAVIWPWLTALILMVFRVSMRRARVTSIHTLRCVLYSSDMFLWAALALAVTVWAGTALNAMGVIDGDRIQWLDIGNMIGAAVALVAAIKLWAAYQNYLRFPHPWQTILASQAIFVMTVLAVA